MKVTIKTEPVNDLKINVVNMRKNIVYKAVSCPNTYFISFAGRDVICITHNHRVMVSDSGVWDHFEVVETNLDMELILSPKKV